MLDKASMLTILDYRIKGLFLVGHWSPHFGRGGLPMVVSSGRDIAVKIINNKKLL
jgi:hypothetical protein